MEPLTDSLVVYSGYIFGGGSISLAVDPLGDTIKVYDSKGNYLFSLDDNKKEITQMTAWELYEKGIQWFEPMADNYMPLLHVSEDILSNKRIMHFSWIDIIDFAYNIRSPLAFLSGRSGDWKVSAARGYFLVTVGGMPYWADAIGNFVFGLWAYNYLSERDPNMAWYEKLIEATALSVHFDEGNWQELLTYSVLGRMNLENIVRNKYDYYMALWGAYVSYLNMCPIGSMPPKVPLDLKISIMEVLKSRVLDR